jgi:mRNA interferase MazF
VTAYGPGDIVFLEFPFTSGVASKRRPSLVLLDADNGDVLFARITTGGAKLDSDVALRGWREAGLLAPSTVRLAKLVTVDNRLVLRTFGHLSDLDTRNVAGALQRLFRDWPASSTSPQP